MRATSLDAPARVLDEGESLQHRVVQVGGDLSSLLLLDAGRAFRDEFAPQAKSPRSEQNGCAGKRDGDDGRPDPS
jgi:hypothetical protein